MKNGQLAEHEYKEYPDDLPFPRRMRYGPQTSEEARQFLDVDYPLPGTFPSPEGRARAPAWVEYIEKGLSWCQVNSRNGIDSGRQVERLAASCYVDAAAARSLMEFDRLIEFI